MIAQWLIGAVLGVMAGAVCIFLGTRLLEMLDRTEPFTREQVDEMESRLRGARWER